MVQLSTFSIQKWSFMTLIRIDSNINSKCKLEKCKTLSFLMISVK